MCKSRTYAINEETKEGLKHSDQTSMNSCRKRVVKAKQNHVATDICFRLQDFGLHWGVCKKEKRSNAAVLSVAPPSWNTCATRIIIVELGLLE